MSHRSLGVVLVSVASALPATANECSTPFFFGPATGGYHSPDRKYFLYYKNDNEWDPGRFALYSYKTVNGKRRVTRKLLDKGITRFQQFMWVPNRPHTLLFSAYTGIGKERPPFIALWDTQKVRILRRGRPSHSNAGLAFFLMIDISVDGRILTYHYFEPGLPSALKSFTKRRRLIVPASQSD